MGFNIRTAPQKVSVMDLRGELDRHLGIKDLRGTIANLHPSQETRLIFNFKDVTYVCSEAVGTICSLAEEIRRAGGHVACCALTGLPKDVFELLGVGKILSLYETEAAALKGIAAEPAAGSSNKN